MEMPRGELEERMRRAAEIRRTLRRATRKLAAFGVELLRARESLADHDVAGRFVRASAGM